MINVINFIHFDITPIAMTFLGFILALHVVFRVNSSSIEFQGAPSLRSSVYDISVRFPITLMDLIIAVVMVFSILFLACEPFLSVFPIRTRTPYFELLTPIFGIFSWVWIAFSGGALTQFAHVVQSIFGYFVTMKIIRGGGKWCLAVRATLERRISGMINIRHGLHPCLNPPAIISSAGRFYAANYISKGGL